MNDVPAPTPMYLQVGAETVFAMLHEPVERGQQIAVLICPPFGWDEIGSYRSRRDWAVELAGAGHPTMRLDLPSCGDSGGSPHDPGRFGAWSDSLIAATDHLRRLTACETTVAIGIGLGGFALLQAISSGACIDDIVLWGVPARGRAMTRELRAFARLQDGGSNAHPEAGLRCADGDSRRRRIPPLRPDGR